MPRTWWKLTKIANFVADQLGEILWIDVIQEITLLGILCRSLLFDSKSGLLGSWYIQLLLSSEGLNTLTVKCFRRRVWETLHSVATGWELLSHFSDVWCSSLLQLTRSSIWQRESLFRCQMWPHWMYVPNNVIRKENKSQLTIFYIILLLPEITLPQQQSITADIRHCEALRSYREIKLLSSGRHRLPRFRCYLN